MSESFGRYEGKPMLRLIDAYVLDALGALDEETARNNAAMVEELSAALHVEADTWQCAVEKAMDMPPDSSGALRAMWEQHVYGTLEEGVTSDVLAWAHELVDRTFSDS